MHQYLTMLDHVLTHGKYRTDRTGTGTYSVFGYQNRYDLSEGFPLLTTKRIHTRSVVGELLWFLRGDSNIKWLNDRRITIWDEWADEYGNLGPVYGHQWRSWWVDGEIDPVDQIATLVRDLQVNPFSRRHVVSAWNVASVADMALPPCHALFQFYVEPDEHGDPARLSCQLYQRSADIFLGVPFNIASYALLTHIIAREVDLQPGDFVHSFGDLHLYANHVEQARTQLSRDPRPLPELRFTTRQSTVDATDLPTATAGQSNARLYTNGKQVFRPEWTLPASADTDVIGHYSIDDFVFHAYDPHPSISAPIAV